MGHSAASSHWDEPAAVWNVPEVGRVGLNLGEKPGWTVETGCLAWLSVSRGHVGTPKLSGLLHLGAARLCQALRLQPHSSRISLIKALDPATILKEM